MKRGLLMFGFILVGLYVLLSVLDTGEYATEKRLWHLQKRFQELARDPVAFPEIEQQGLIDSYKAVIRDFPRSRLNGQVLLQIARIYTFKKDYALAKETLGQISKLYPKDAALNAEALFNVGLVWESENNQKEALNAYQQVVDKYALTAIGLNVPLHVANYYQRLKQPGESRQALERAVFFYDGIVNKYQHTSIGFEALRFLATTYLAQQDWHKSIAALGQMLMDYSTGPYLDERQAILYIRTINTISINQLKDYELPIGIYRGFIKKYPGHPFNPIFEKVIAEIRNFRDNKAKAPQG